MKKLLSIIFISAAVSANAQMLTPTVIASSGGFFFNTAGMLSFTVGELAAVSTISSANNILTQGFQQPEDFGVFVPSVDASIFYMNVFPNPSNGHFSIFVNTPKEYNLSYSVYDMLGQIVIATTAKTSRGNTTLPVDLSRQVVGMYLLECVFTDIRSGEKFTNYSKLNLVY
jgi:hypothetical protein